MIVVYSLFEKVLLGQPLTEEPMPAAPPQAGAPVMPLQQQDLGAGTPPPDFTGGQPGPELGGAPDPNQQPMDPNAGMQPGVDPNQQMASDPNAQGDPNQQMDPNQAMDQMDQMQDPATQSPETEIEKDEEVIFSDLKPEQMLLKNTELKQRYQELFKAVTETLTKINKVSRTSYDDTMIDFIIKKLTNLKTMITDSLVNAYPARTYLENKTELQRFTYGFNYITRLVTNIYESRIKRQQAIAKMNSKIKPEHEPEEFPIFNRGYDVQ